MPDEQDAGRRLKVEIRKQAHANRAAQPDKDAVSRAICDKFAALPEYAAGRTILYYVHFRDEVRTQELLAAALETDKKVVIPYCVKDVLELFHLESWDEMTGGMWGILEPKPELRTLEEKRVDVRDVDLIMVPGVAFDRRGGRTGHGRGYYDKLLEHARPETPLVAVAYECQIFPEIPMQPHDIFMDKVITEKAIYQGKGRSDGTEQ